MSNEHQDITAVLAQVASAVVGQFEMNKLLAQIIETTMKALDAEVCSIFLRKEDDVNQIICRAGSGFAKNLVGVAEYKSGEGFTGSIFKSGEGKNIRSREELEQGNWIGKYDQKQWTHGKNEFRCMIALPLKIKDEILGVVKVENKKNMVSFSDRDHRVFETIANVIALAIENVRLQDQGDIQSRKIAETLATVASVVVGQFERKPLLDIVLNATMTTLEAEVCSIFLRKDDDYNKIICVAGAGFASNIVGAEYEMGEGITGTVAQKEQEINIRSPQDFDLYKRQGIWCGKYDRKQWGGGIEFRNLLALPLKIKGIILGVMKVENKKLKYGSSFTDEDLQIFRTIANVIALTIENSKLYEENKQQLKSISSRAAHRINNQVANYDYIELKLLKEAKVLSGDAGIRFINLAQKIGEYTRNLKRMIGEFKDFGKPLTLNRELVDINSLIRHEVEQYHVKYETEGIAKIHLETDSNIPQFKLDAGRFAESIKEMLGNARRAIEIAKKQGNIYISTQLSEKDGKKCVILLLRDDGPGISKNVALFTPFQSTDPQRTGLGLSTVKELMKAHGGDIEYVPQPESQQGTTFKLMLPITLELIKDEKSSDR